MPNTILSAGPAAATLAAFLIVAGDGAAQAARCPLGEIYRPSRGICVSKARAVQAGIYRSSASRPGPVSLAALEAPAPAAAPPVPRPRPQALAAIERRAPAARPDAEAALAFVPARKPPSGVAQVQPSAFTPVAAPQPSPFGRLVALEPVP